MINDETDNVPSVASSSIAEEIVESSVNRDGNVFHELLSTEQSRRYDRDKNGATEPDKARQSSTNNIQFRPEDLNQDTANLTGEVVSNVEPRHIQFTSTEELYERFPIYSANLLNIWRSNHEVNPAQPSCSQKSKSTNQTVVDKVPDSVSGTNLDSKSLHDENLEVQRRASVDYLNSKLLDNNLKLLKSKCDENQINKTFDCSNRLLEIKKLYGETSRNEKEACDASSAKSNKSTSSISFRETFTNLIQGCNYFENKRLIPSAFRKTDINDFRNQPGAFTDDIDSSDTSCDGNEVQASGEAVQTVNNCKNSRAVNQNNSVDTQQNVDEVNISISDQDKQISNKSKPIVQNLINLTHKNIHDKSDSLVDKNETSAKLMDDYNKTDGGHSNEDNLNHTVHNTFDEALNESIEKGNVFNSTEQSTALDTSDADDKLLHEATGDVFHMSAAELLESLQLSQSSEELHESIGDRPDCMFHLTNDGSQGCDSIRLRVMLPALNKGKKFHLCQ